MSPSSRRGLWSGLGLILVGGHPGGIILFRRSGPALGSVEAEAPLLCLAQEPQFHQGGAGQGPGGQRPGAGLPHAGGGPAARQGPAVAPAAKPAGKTKYWRCPMHPEIVRDSPGKCPNAAWTWCRSSRSSPGPSGSGPGARGSAERAQDQVLGVAHGPRLRAGQARQGPLRHGYGAGL